MNAKEIMALAQVHRRDGGVVAWRAFSDAVKAVVAERDQLRAQLAPAPICTWTQEDDFEMPGVYRSTCGEVWSFVDGGVKENGVKFCHCCGGTVTPVSPPSPSPSD